MRITLTFIAVLFTQLLFAQDAGYFVEQLKDNSDKQVLTRYALHVSLNKLDTIALVKLIDAIEKEVASSSVKMKTRVAALKARSLFYQLGPGDSLYAAQMKDALYKANELDEPYMIAEYSRWYGEMLNSLDRRNEAVQYALNSIVLQEQLGLKNFPEVNTFYFTLGELFLRTGNNDDAIKWLGKGLTLPGTDSVTAFNYGNAMNNQALTYFQLKEYKKSLDGYEKCAAYSMQHNEMSMYYTAFYNRISPMIELGQYDTAKSLLNGLYDNGMEHHVVHTLAGACYMLGQIANRQKDFTTAAQWLVKAEKYAYETGVNSNRTQICKELSICYDGLKQYDKSLLYYKEYQHLDDSIKKAYSTVQSEFLMTKANFEKEQLAFKTLKTKRAADIRLRNIGILLLALLSAIIIWWLNRKRKKAKLDQQNAEEQLKLFTDNIINKDRQIEALQSELQLQSNNAVTAAKVEELSQQMILTEEDWQRFQSLFNKTYPGYLHRLKEKVSGITEAEIRMACLIRIKLNTKQIASMQGISPDSVHKTRQRLRQRFSTASTTELEAILDTV
ncbi:tetratricopeptide repeat protein [Ferruginibacter sp.]